MDSYNVNEARIKSEHPRDIQQRQFAHAKFQWLEQVAVDRELPAHAARVAAWLLHLFNFKYDGVAWPYQDGIAAALGLSRWTVNKNIAGLIKRGHLTSKKQGRDKPNVYRFVLKKHADRTPKTDQFETLDVVEPAHPKTHDVHSTPVRCGDIATLIPSKIPRNAFGVSQGEREGGAAAPAPLGAADAAPKAGSKSASGVGPASVIGAGRFAELRLLWARPWPDDDAVDRKAFEKACREGALADDIIAAAKAWVAAADAPRFLPPLAKWLGARGWEKLPPKRHKRKGGRRYHSGKPDPCRTILKNVGGWIEDPETGDLTNPQTGSVWPGPAG